VTDATGDVETATVTVTIEGTNDQPIASNIAVNVHEDSTAGVMGRFLVSDLDTTDTHTFEIISGPEGGSVTNNNDGTFVFTPDDDYQFLVENQDRDATYVAIDGSGSGNSHSEEKTVTITVEGAYDAPISLTDSLLFTTQDQSMWASGSALVLEPDFPFLGLEWTKEETETTLTIIPSYVFSGAVLDALADAAGWVANAAQDAWDWVSGDDTPDVVVPSTITTPEVSVSGWTSGKIGLQPYFSMTSGDVDSSLPIEISFLVPNQAEQGQTITIETGYSLDGGATFNTASPDASMGLDLVFQFNAGATANIGSDSFSIFEMPAINETFNLIDFSAEDIELSLDFEGPASGADLGNFTVGVPVINTEGTPNPAGSDATLSSAGEDSIMSLTLDVDGYLSEAVAMATGVPLPLENTWSTSIGGLGLELAGVSARYNIFDIELTGDLKAVPNFSLNIDELPLLILLENGSQLTNYKAGDSVTFDVPTFDVDTEGDADGWLDFDVTVDMDAILNNLTTLGFDLTLAMEALSASLAITSDLFVGPSMDFGPVWEDSFELYSTDNFATLFEDDIQLLGFNQEITSQQLDVSIV
jgi:VCBS repeat-containing protein